MEVTDTKMAKKKIILHGQLGKKYGSQFELDVLTPGEAVRALCLQIPGFEKDIRAGEFFLYRGKKNISEDYVNLEFGKEEKFHLVPVVAGAKKGGVGKAILTAVMGIALIAAAVIFAPAAGLGAAAFSVAGSSVTFGQIALLGGALVLAGASQLIAGSQKVRPSDYGQRDSAEERKSFLFDGPTNTTAQGVAVPIVYGRMRVGSIVISSGMSIAQIAQTSPPVASEIKPVGTFDFLTSRLSTGFFPGMPANSNYNPWQAHQQRMKQLGVNSTYVPTLKIIPGTP